MLPGSTEIITGERQIIEAIARFQAGTRQLWCACVERSLPAFSVGKVKDGYAAAAKRGVKIKYITEITVENLSYCKELMQVVELRHLEGVRGNFALSDKEYVAGVMEKNVMRTLIRTDVAEFVGQQRLVFQTLWHHAIPAADRIARIS